MERRFFIDPPQEPPASDLANEFSECPANHWFGGHFRF
jgi:hypothetical protein